MERNSEIEISLNFCMDSYSILDNSPSQAAPETVPPQFVSSRPPTSLTKAPVLREALRFPGEDGGKSLGEMAKRDLDATLQLLAERAQYITGASGAAIALREGESMVCCASSGPSAPELGAHLQIDSGLSAESVRTRKILICEDAENDPRVNRESCKTFGIASVVVMPLVRGEEVYGVFELLSGRTRAFEERDFVALKRLADMIQTAVELSDGARHAEKEFGQPGMATAVMVEPNPTDLLTESGDDILEAASESPKSELQTTTKIVPTPAAVESADVVSALAPTPELGAIPEPVDEHQAETNESGQVTSIAFGNLRRCETCAFPVSEGRRLCLDCEAATPDAVAIVNSTPEFFGQLDDSNTSWVKSHAYLVATAVIAVATIALLLWRF